MLVWDEEEQRTWASVGGITRTVYHWSSGRPGGRHRDETQRQEEGNKAVTKRIRRIWIPMSGLNRDAGTEAERLGMKRRLNSRYNAGPSGTSPGRRLHQAAARDGRGDPGRRRSGCSTRPSICPSAIGDEHLARSVHMGGELRLVARFESGRLARLMRTVGAAFEIDPPLPATLDDYVKCRCHIRPAKTPTAGTCTICRRMRQGEPATYAQELCGGRVMVDARRRRPALRKIVLPY